MVHTHYTISADDRAEMPLIYTLMASRLHTFLRGLLLTPEATVHAVDLFPSPVTWAPSNCVLEVDDILKEWTWQDSFDFIHRRFMLGAFTPKEWESVYQQCYECVPVCWNFACVEL